MNILGDIIHLFGLSPSQLKPSNRPFSHDTKPLKPTTYRPYNPNPWNTGDTTHLVSVPTSHSSVHRPNNHIGLIDENGFNVNVDAIYSDDISDHSINEEFQWNDDHYQSSTGTYFIIVLFDHHN